MSNCKYISYRTVVQDIFKNCRQDYLFSKFHDALLAVVKKFMPNGKKIWESNSENKLIGYEFANFILLQSVSYVTWKLN